MPYCVIHDVRVKANKDVIRSRVFVSYGQRNEEEKMVATEIEIRLLFIKHWDFNKKYLKCLERA